MARTLGWSTAAAVLGTTILVTLLRLAQPALAVTPLLVGFAPLAVVSYPVAALLLVALRRTAPRLVAALLVVCLAGTALHLSWVVPRWVRDADQATAYAGPGADVTLLTTNLLHGRADPASVLDVVGEVDPDLLVLEEVEVPVLAVVAAGLPTDLVRVAGVPGRDDTVVLSRLPARSPEALRLRLAGWRVPSRVGGRTVQVYGVHPFSPKLSPATWRADHAAIRDSLASHPGPALVVGDLNATADHGPLLALRELGLRDSSDVAGSGWQATYPAGLPGPAVLPIDHVLVRGPWQVRGTATHPVADSDHLAFSARLVLTP